MACPSWDFLGQEAGREARAGLPRADTGSGFSSPSRNGGGGVLAPHEGVAGTEMSHRHRQGSSESVSLFLMSADECQHLRQEPHTL